MRTYGVCIIVIVGFALSGCATSNSASLDSGKRHHSKDGFVNPHIEDPDNGFFDFLRMRFLGDETWADHFSLAHTVGAQQVDIAKLRAQAPHQVTWLGHSTFLIQHSGVTVLTDPIFSDRASPTSFAGPSRYTPHAMDYDNLPAIDWVVISHNHYDHLDAPAIRQLAEKSAQQTSPIQFAVPLGLQEILLDNNVLVTNIHELDWWQQTEQNDVLIEALPSQHWSSRSLSDTRHTLWARWAITIDDYKIWFAGDTGYNKVQFAQIGAHLGTVNLALIPIGAYAPRWFMQAYHINPQEAVMIHKEVNSQFSIGMHWGTFSLSAESPMEPVEELSKQLKLQNLSEQAFVAMDIGQTLALPAKGKLDKKVRLRAKSPKCTICNSQSVK
jgi:N-acyl-phosphatidylethanolamine-hydrolysing phospholipase D